MATYPSTLNSVNFSVSGAIKSDRVQPIFKVIEDYDRRALYAAGKNNTNTSKKDNAVKMTWDESKKRGHLFAEDPGPIWHKISNPMVTPPIIAENLLLQFKDLPIFGAPDSSSNLEEYEDNKIREFVGFDLNDEEFDELKNYCE